MGVIVFTGGGSGLALASAHCMVEEGTLLLCDRSAAALEQAKAELTAMGADVETCACDVTDAESVGKMAAFAASLGDVSTVVHAAGVSPANSPTDLVFAVNGLGPINMVNAFYPLLAKGGVMVCFGSKASYSFETNAKMAPLAPLVSELYSHWDEPDFADQMKAFVVNVMQVPQQALAGSAYVVTKNFTRYFAKMNVKRFAEKGCRILSVSPGSYLTPMHQALIDNAPESAEWDMSTIPLRRWGRPYEMAHLVKFLCSKGAGYITGVDILADGGSTFGTAIPQIE